MNKRIALVTEATKGIGKAIAKQLIDENYIVIAVDVDEVSGEMLIEEIGDKNIEFIGADISMEIDITSLFAHIKSKYNHLDVLVNNAGIIRDNMIWNMPVEDFDMV